MPKLVKINSDDISCSGTCFVGTLIAPYQSIADKLGAPGDSFDNYKTDGEWVLEFENGIVATIYNWKNGKNYCGDEGLELEDIEEWHIGGRTHQVACWVEDLIKNSWPIFDEIRQSAQD